MDFYIIREGRIEVRKETPFGAQRLAEIGADKIVGEMNFIDRTHRSSDAIPSPTPPVTPSPSVRSTR